MAKSREEIYECIAALIADGCTAEEVAAAMDSDTVGDPGIAGDGLVDFNGDPIPPGSQIITFTNPATGDSEVVCLPSKIADTFGVNSLSAGGEVDVLGNTLPTGVPINTDANGDIICAVNARPVPSDAVDPDTCSPITASSPKFFETMSTECGYEFESPSGSTVWAKVSGPHGFYRSRAQAGGADAFLDTTPRGDAITAEATITLPNPTCDNMRAVLIDFIHSDVVIKVGDEVGLAGVNMEHNINGAGWMSVAHAVAGSKFVGPPNRLRVDNWQSNAVVFTNPPGGSTILIRGVMANSSYGGSGGSLVNNPGVSAVAFGGFEC